jgi:DNA recombination protein RmuC
MSDPIIILSALFILLIIVFGFVFIIKKMDSKFNNIIVDVNNNVSENNLKMVNNINTILQQNNTGVSENYNSQLKTIATSHTENMEVFSKVLGDKVNDSTSVTNKLLNQLTEKITSIEQAKKEITKLSENVIGLENVLANKQARGAFGEIQLDKIMGEIFSNYQYTLQRKLSNDSRVDCALSMPNDLILSIDSKFPLESYKKIIEKGNEDLSSKNIKQFKIDIKKHIDVISSKYIISGETSDYAVMFIPSDAVYYELSENHFDLIDYSQRKKIIIVSPSTIVSILLATHALIKDEKMQKEISKFKDLVESLVIDLDRFEKRFDQLGLRSKQIGEELLLVETSFNKIKAKAGKLKSLDID